MSNQSSIQQSIRTITSTSGSYNEDWLGLFDYLSIAAGTFNERMETWLRFVTSSSKTNINDLKAEYASQLGLNSWDEITGIIPLPVSGFQLWQDAADASTILDPTVPGSVDTWVDKSGNGNNSTQTTPTSKPTTGTKELNGNNVVGFSADFLEMDASIYPLPNGDNTIFIVPKVNTIDAFVRRFISFGNGATQRFVIQYISSTSTVSFLSNNLGGGSGVSNTATLDKFNTFTGRRTGSEQYLSVNGGTPVTNGSATDASDVDSANLGVNSSGSGFAFDGQLAELIIYNRSLSDIEINQVEIYLADKWGVYHPDANWITNSGYTTKQQAIIHSLKLNKDDAFQDTTGNTLEGWFKGQNPFLLDGNDAVITVDSTPIATPLDDSGHNHDGDKQNTGTARPTYVANAINGEGVMSSDGGDYLDLPSTFFDVPNDDFTIFVVATRDNTTGFQRMVYWDDGGGTNQIHIIYDAGANTIRGRIGLAGSVINHADIGAGPNVIALRKQGTTIGLSVNNGTEVTGNAANSFTSTLAQIFADNLTLTGDIPEVLIIRKSLDFSSREFIFNMLGTTYNITQS